MILFYHRKNGFSTYFLLEMKKKSSAAKRRRIQPADKAIGSVSNCMGRVQRGDGSPLSAFNPCLFGSILKYSRIIQPADKAIGSVSNCTGRVQRGDGSPLSAFNPCLFGSIQKYSRIRFSCADEVRRMKILRRKAAEDRNEFLLTDYSPRVNSGQSATEVGTLFSPLMIAVLAASTVSRTSAGM